MNRRDQLVQAGRWLRLQRERRDLGARDIAQQLGVLPQTVYNWESGKSGVDDDRAEQISELFDLDIIEVRRNLGLWVPPEAKGEAPVRRRSTPTAELLKRLEEDPELAASMAEFFRHARRSAPIDDSSSGDQPATG